MAGQAKNKQQAPPPSDTNGNGDQKGPLHRFHYPVYNGTLSVSIFDKEINTDNGSKTVYSVSVQRSYTKDKVKEWTYYLRDSDLPVAAIGLHEAFRWIGITRQRQYEQQRSSSNGDDRPHERPDEDIPF